MAWSLVIDFDVQPGDGVFIHRMRNFGEDLWRACKTDGWASMSLDEIDRATNQLTVTVATASKVRRTARMASKLMESHFLAPPARITITNLRSV